MTNEQIVAEILDQRKGETGNHALHLAVGRADANVSGMSQSVFWLYNQEYSKEYGSYGKQRYNQDKGRNHCIAKNSRLGEFLIRRKSGSYQTVKGNLNVEFSSLTSYQPKRQPKIDAVNGTIEIVGEPKFIFSSVFEISEFIKRQSNDSLATVEQLLLDQKDALELGKQLSEEEERQIRELLEITRYIRQTNDLRQQPILDAIQENVKRSRIFDGLLVIDGGPGTGKTVTLIQRLKFLSDETITEYRPDLAKVLPEIQSDKGWIFFSPSNLLLGYLRNAMVEEGLKASDQRSKVWSNFLNNEVLHNYGLIGAEKPFQLYRKSVVPLFSNEPGSLKYFVEAFSEFIQEQIKGLVTRCTAAKILDEDNRQFAIQVRGNSAGLVEQSDLIKVIVAADELNRRFDQDFASIEKRANDLLEREADFLLVQLRKATDKYNKVAQHLKGLFDQKRQITNAEENDDEQDLEIEVEEQEVKEFNEAVQVRKAVKMWVKHLALNKAVSTNRIPEKQREWVLLIEELRHDGSFEELGKKLHLVKYLSPLIKGSKVIVLNKLSSFYKRFRKTLPSIFGSRGLEQSMKEMQTVLNADGARLHTDERNFLILFVNTLIRDLQRRKAVAFQRADHLFVISYIEQQRYLIGVDEASDFSLVELACMHSFSHPEYNCTTLSGDLMQRMTKSGVEDWDGFVDYLGSGQIEHLKVSYRQSPTLLDLAKLFYRESTGVNADYISYTVHSPYEPKPEVKKLETMQQKVDWISEKINGIYKTYAPKVPSIAIFVPNDEQVHMLSKALNDCEDLGGNGIDIKGVTQDGATLNKGQVNVYNIQAIKGLEFEAVFFIDIDELNESNNDLLRKYIYVGISRAAFYLFVSFRYKLPEQLAMMDKFIV